MNMVSLTHLQKQFGKQIAVDLDELSIQKGEIYGLIGPNGAGKSTIMKMVCGLLSPTRGQIHVNGQLMNQEHRLSIVKEIGSLIEEPAYYDNLTGLENLQIVQHLKGLSNQDVMESLSIVGLIEHKDKIVKHYSLGMKQRLGIAMAIIGRSRLVVLDEPTNGLDPQAREEVRQLIRSLPERFQTTVMISSHALDEIEKMVTQIGIIGRGTLLYQGGVDQFKRRHASHLLLETADDELALALLSNPAGQVTPKGLLLPYADREIVARWVKQLVTADLAIYRVTEESKSLEQVFIEFTENHVL